MALRRCPGHLCPELVPPGQFCPRHRRAKEKKRGTPTQRGYGAQHRYLRKTYEKRMAEGEAFVCVRCGRVIKYGEAWDLGHTEDRSGYNGPEHASCNRKAGGINGGIVAHRSV